MFLIDDSLIETPFKVFSNLNMKIFSSRQPNETCLEFKNTKKNNFVFFLVCENCLHDLVEQKKIGKISGKKKFKRFSKLLLKKHFKMFFFMNLLLICCMQGFKGTVQRDLFG